MKEDEKEDLERQHRVWAFCVRSVAASLFAGFVLFWAGVCVLSHVIFLITNQ